MDFQERSNGRATLHEGRDDLQLVNLVVPPRSTIVVSNINWRNTMLSYLNQKKDEAKMQQPRKGDSNRAPSTRKSNSSFLSHWFAFVALGRTRVWHRASSGLKVMPVCTQKNNGTPLIPFGEENRLRDAGRDNGTNEEGPGTVEKESVNSDLSSANLTHR